MRHSAMWLSSILVRLVLTTYYSQHFSFNYGTVFSLSMSLTGHCNEHAHINSSSICFEPYQPFPMLRQQSFCKSNGQSLPGLCTKLHSSSSCKKIEPVLFQWLLKAYIPRICYLSHYLS